MKSRGIESMTPDGQCGLEMAERIKLYPVMSKSDVLGLSAAVSISIRWERNGDVVAAPCVLQDSAFSALQGQFDTVVPCDS